MATPTVSKQIHGKLHALRRAVLRWLFVKGLAFLLVVTVLLLLAELFIDWNWQMDKLQRAICMLGIAGVMIYLAFTRMLKPMFHSLPIDTLALQVEDQHKDELKQAREAKRSSSSATRSTCGQPIVCSCCSSFC